MTIRLVAIPVMVALVGLIFWPRSDAAILLSEAIAVNTEDGLAVFMKIENRGPPDRLLGATSPEGEAHVYSPEAETGPPAPSGPGASLAADGAHVQLTGVADKTEGRLIPLVLTFERAGEISVKARIGSATPAGGAAEAGLFGLGDICIVGEGEPAPAISLVARRDGEGWRIGVKTDEFIFSKERTGLFHVPGEGHGHIYVGGMKLGRLYQPTAHIGALPAGRHRIRVTLNTNDHRAYVVDGEPATAVVEIAVD